MSRIAQIHLIKGQNISHTNTKGKECVYGRFADF